MKILKITDKNAKAEAVKCLKNGNILIFPTETCYGVGVDAKNPRAVSKVLDYKMRPPGKPVSIAVFSKEKALEYVDLNDSASRLYDNFLPGPVTVISKSKGVVDERLESERGTLGIRIPDYPFMLEILKEFDGPVTSTSANSAGKKTPYKISDIFENISKKQMRMIDLVIDAGELPHNPPSTVIDTTNEDMTIYRKGLIDLKSSFIDSQIINSKIETLRTNSPLETEIFGEKLIKKFLNPKDLSPLIFLLNGKLGAGKTQLTKGIAKALGISRNIKSPTYTYVEEYKINSKFETLNSKKTENLKSSRLYHVDAWKVQSKEDLDLLDFKSFFISGNVIVIEWPSVIMNIDEDLLQSQKPIWVDIKDLGGDTREIQVIS